MSENNGGPAFPYGPGTLRDYFAGQALVASLLNGFAGPSPKDRALLCYNLADAMIAERDKS